jgi:hypothetical protein
MTKKTHADTHNTHTCTLLHVVAHTTSTSAQEDGKTQHPRWGRPWLGHRGKTVMTETCYLLECEVPTPIGALLRLLTTADVGKMNNLFVPPTPSSVSSVNGPWHIPASSQQMGSHLPRWTLVGLLASLSHLVKSFFAATRSGQTRIASQVEPRFADPPSQSPHVGEMYSPGNYLSPTLCHTGHPSQNFIGRTRFVCSLVGEGLTCNLAWLRAQA